MNILTKILFGLTTIFLIAVIALTFFGELTFGYGLGDLFYLMFSGVAQLIVTVTYFVTKKFDFNKNKLAGGIVSIGLLLTIYIFGRLVTAAYYYAGNLIKNEHFAFNIYLSQHDNFVSKTGTVAGRGTLPVILNAKN